MGLVEKNAEGKVARILGVEAQLVIGLLLLLSGALIVLWAYFEEVVGHITRLVG